MGEIITEDITTEVQCNIVIFREEGIDAKLVKEAMEALGNLISFKLDIDLGAISVVQGAEGDNTNDSVLLSFDFSRDGVYRYEDRSYYSSFFECTIPDSELETGEMDFDSAYDAALNIVKMLQVKMQIAFDDYDINIERNVA